MLIWRQIIATCLSKVSLSSKVTPSSLNSLTTETVVPFSRTLAGMHTLLFVTNMIYVLLQLISKQVLPAEGRLRAPTRPTGSAHARAHAFGRARDASRQISAVSSLALRQRKVIVNFY